MNQTCSSLSLQYSEIKIISHKPLYFSMQCHELLDLDIELSKLLFKSYLQVTHFLPQTTSAQRTSATAQELVPCKRGGESAPFLCQTLIARLACTVRVCRCVVFLGAGGCVGNYADKRLQLPPIPQTYIQQTFTIHYM